VNPKWHFKIKQFNVKTAVLNLPGLQTNKNFISKKVLTHRSVAKTVEQKLEQLTMVVEVVKADQDNLLKSHVQIVVEKILCLFNQEVTSRFFAVIVSKKNEADKLLFLV
jgi:hypothetical protein